AELDLAYDSSIYPVRHDRYGVPGAPRAPFLAGGERHTIQEIPPATLRVLGANLPMGGWVLPPLPPVPDGVGHPADGAELCAAGGHAVLPPLGVRPPAGQAATAAPPLVPNLRGPRQEPGSADGPAGEVPLQPGDRRGQAARRAPGGVTALRPG